MMRGALWAALLWAALAPLAEGDAQPLLLNKCCPLAQRLDEATRACEPHENATRPIAGTDDPRQKEFWWLNAKVRVAPGGKVSNMLALSLNIKGLYNKRPCGPDLTAISWNEEVSFHLNGSLQMNLLKSMDPGRTEAYLLPPEDYCVDKTSRKGKLHLVFLACPCRRVLCVRKCCDYKRMLSISEAIALQQKAHCNELLPPDFTWNAPFRTLSAGAERKQTVVSYARLRGPFSNTCPPGRMNVNIEISDKKNSTLLFNGTLVAGVIGSFHADRFCVDYGKHKGKDGFFASVCAEGKKKKPMGLKNYVYVSLYLVGLVFLMLTLVVYALLPELRRPVNAKALMCHTAALASALLVLAVGQCIHATSYAACATMAFFGQFFLLSAFFWLTVLCFDITRGFRDVLPINDARSANRRLLYYSLFAWGGPTIIVAITAALNYAPGLPDWVQKPEIGFTGCWLRHTWAELYYLYGPLACLLLINAVMFSYTMVRLRAAESGRDLLKNEDSRLSGGSLRKRREWLLLYAKLFCLMGVTWLLEVVTWAAGTDGVLEMILDAVNVLRGVGVFVACCCKRNVLCALGERFNGVLPCVNRPRVEQIPPTFSASLDLSRRVFITNGEPVKHLEEKAT